MQMGIGHSGSGRKGKDKRRLKKLSQVQRLYETCKEVFADCSPGIIPSPDKVEKLTAVLDGISQADVGLRPNMSFFNDERAPIISYMHLHECDQFSIGIFCLPPASVIPLHNHPGMTVFSKLLFGTMHIKSYDWLPELDKNIDATDANIDDTKNHLDGLRLAKLKVNSEFTAPCTTSILYPAEGGNMHVLTAKTACAVLDVLGPPYSDPEGRHCQYYHEISFTKYSAACSLFVPEDQQDELAWLEERENPQDLSFVGVPYNGPRIAKCK